MTDLELLRKAVVDNPLEDAPRLAYADELISVGGKANLCHAKFIQKTYALETAHGPDWFTGADVALENDRRWAAARVREHWRAFAKAPNPVYPVLEYALADGSRRVLAGGLLYAPRMHSYVPVLGALFVMSDGRHVGTPESRLPYHDLKNPHTNWWVFQKGFVGRLRCSWSYLVANGSALFDSEPVTRVDLTERPSGFAIVKLHNERLGLNPSTEVVRAGVVNVDRDPAYWLSRLWPKIAKEGWHLP